MWKFLCDIVKLADSIYPKDSDVIIFGSNGGNHFSGSPQALFQYIKSHKTGFHGYYFQKKPFEKDQIGASSLRDLLTFLRAGTIVSSHGLNDFSFFRASRCKLHICTWHGILLKSSGHLVKLTDSERKNLREYVSAIDIVLTSSYYDASTLNLAFDHGTKCMRLTGHPRNDRFVHFTSKNKQNLKNFLPWINGDEKVILYAPTFRDRAMGPQAIKIPIFPFPDFDQKTFFRYLEENNILLLVRLHVNDSTSDWTLNNERVVYFSYDVCPDINQVIGDVDTLITDYSSIAWDYLLLDRPIIFIPYDFEMFSRARGFIVDDYEFWIPGPSVSSMKDVIHHLEPMIGSGNDEYIEKRQSLRKVIHSHQTSNTSSIVLKMIRDMRE